MSNSHSGATPYYYVPHASRHPAMAALGLFFVISVYARRTQELVVRGLAATPLLIKPLLLAAVVLVLHLLGPSGVPAFLYYSY